MANKLKKEDFSLFLSQRIIPERRMRGVTARFYFFFFFFFIEQKARFG